MAPHFFSLSCRLAIEKAQVSNDVPAKPESDAAVVTHHGLSKVYFMNYKMNNLINEM